MSKKIDDPLFTRLKIILPFNLLVLGVLLFLAIGGQNSFLTVIFGSTSLVMLIGSALLYVYRKDITSATVVANCVYSLNPVYLLGSTFMGAAAFSSGHYLFSVPFLIATLGLIGLSIRIAWVLVRAMKIFGILGSLWHIAGVAFVFAFLFLPNVEQ